jgi:L-lactate dehydrogenase
MPVSVVLHGEYGIEGCALSVPAIVGHNGIEDLVPIAMSEEERDALDHSASVLRQNMADIDFTIPE